MIVSSPPLPIFLPSEGQKQNKLIRTPFLTLTYPLPANVADNPYLIYIFLFFYHLILALCPLIMGNEIQVRDLVDEGNHAVILTSHPILCEGYIRKFTIKRSNEAMEAVTFLVWRPHPDDPSKFIIVGSAQLTIEDDTMDLGTDKNTKIPFKTGDFIGFMSLGGTVFYDDGNKLGDGGNILTAPVFDNIEPMTEVSFQPVDGVRAYSINVELECKSFSRDNIM